MIGIYKITSPNGRIYIGQSVDIEYRFSKYRILNCKSQVKLYRSFIKNGLENHIFEVIEECDESILNDRERYWQDYYSVLTNGLNCRLTTSKDKSGSLSKSTRLKIGKGNKGKIKSVESRLKISLANLDGKNRKCKKVICTETNKEWYSAKNAAIENNIKYTTLMKKLNGVLKNTTTLKYIQDDDR